MFENGNYRRRRRMKRPYRTNTHYSKVYEPYATGNFGSRVFSHSSYPQYTRSPFDT